MILIYQKKRNCSHHLKKECEMDYSNETARMYQIKEIREDTIKAIVNMNLADNWQNVNTPYWVVRNMLDLIPESDMYIVFFSMEFLEVMIHERNIPREKVIFVADTVPEMTYAKSKLWYNVKSVLYPKQIVTKESIENVLKGVDMKFKKIAVVGNPPYQIQSEAQKNRSSEDSQSKPLYHLFVESVIDGIRPDYFSFIIPSRWMVGGMGLNNHRERMMNDRRMKTIVHIPDSSEIFSTVDIKGGVNYFLWDKSYNGKCEFIVGDTSSTRYLNDYDIILQDNMAITILDKVKQTSNEWISTKAFGNKPFGIATNFKNWSEEGTVCISIGLKENRICEIDYSDNNNIKNKWKVCTSKAGDGGFGNCDKNGKCSVIGRAFILEPEKICTETYIVVNVFDTKEESENFISYMKTKFFRFMLGLRVQTQDVNKGKFSWVPDMIDYTMEYNDECLYDRFYLNEDEIKYIESKIKEI